VIAEKLEIPLEVVAVSKITLRRTPRHAMVPHRPLLSRAH
jgi:hypothetical protein